MQITLRFDAEEARRAWLALCHVNANLERHGRETLSIETWAARCVLAGAAQVEAAIRGAEEPRELTEEVEE